MIYYSVENLKTETLDRETRNRILSLSYKKFFQDSVNNETEITNLNKSIENLYTDYNSVAKVLKEKFKTYSFESGETSGTVKNKFFANIKNFFVKVWAFIVTIFEKIVMVIQSLIKSLILYIKKHLILKNSLYTKLKKEDNSLSFTNPSEAMRKHVCKMLNEKIVVNTIDIKGEKLATFDDLFGCLKNHDLMIFMKSKIIINNKKSSLNTENLKNLLNIIQIIDESGNQFTGDSKLAQMSEAINNFASQSVLYGETDSDGRLTSIYGEVNSNDRALLDLLSNGNVKGAANTLVFGNTDIGRGTMNVNEFMGLSSLGITGYNESNVTSALSLLRYNLSKYELAANLVIGKGGYLEVITEVLKRYSVAANNDKKNIKAIKDAILKTLDTIDNDSESGQKVTNRCKRFTNIVVRVQKIKNEFVYLRQCVLGNVLSAFSVMDKALSSVLIPSNISGTITDDNDYESIVGGKNGVNPTKGFVDDSDAITAQQQLDEID